MAIVTKAAAARGDTPQRKKKAVEKMESAGMMRWLLTYADMITLLLALFIILFAISTISRVKFQTFAKDISAGFNNDYAINNPPNGGTTGSQTGSNGEANLKSIQLQVQSYVRTAKLEKKVQTRIDKRGLVITLLTDKALYDSGSAVLKPDTEQLLDEVVKQLRSHNNEIRIEGNTDTDPIATSSFPTNWELSTARATGVTRYLVEHDRFDPRLISAAGYGQYQPRFPNDTEAHKQLNRRVDLVILNGQFAHAEGGGAQ